MGNACGCADGSASDLALPLDDEVGPPAERPGGAGPRLSERPREEEEPAKVVEEPKAPVIPKVAAAAAKAELVGAEPIRDEPFQDKMYRLTQEDGEREVTVAAKVLRRPSSVDVTLDAYAARHAAEFDAVLGLEKPAGWDFQKEEEGVKIYTKGVPGRRLHYFKGVADFKCEGGIMPLLRKIIKTEDRPKWDELCSYGASPEYIPPFYKYAYVQLKSPSPIISPRDILMLGRFRFEEDGAVVMTLQSATHPDFPERPDYVRINFVEGGYVIRPKGDHMVTVTWTGLVDPRGWLPTWLVNAAVWKQALSLAKIKRFL